MKYNDYYYKCSSLNNHNELERQKFEIVNEYGYNFGSDRMQKKDYEDLLFRPKNKINKEYINSKR